MYAFSPYLAELSFVVCAWSFFLSAENMVTESAVAILQPHTSSPSPRAIARGIGTLITNMSGDDLPKILNAQLDALSIPQQAKQAIVPALLGIARLTEVQLRGTPGSPPRTQIVPNLAEVTVDATPGPGSTVHFQTRQRSFTSSSGSGHTVWYFGKSDRGISSPPVVPQARTGRLYVHFDTSMNAHQYWMLGTNNQWESVSRGAEYPLNHDRVLTIRSNVHYRAALRAKQRKEPQSHHVPKSPRSDLACGSGGRPRRLRRRRQGGRRRGVQARDDERDDADVQSAAGAGTIDRSPGLGLRSVSARSALRSPGHCLAPSVTTLSRSRSVTGGGKGASTPSQRPSLAPWASEPHFRPTSFWTHESRVPPAHLKLKGAGLCARVHLTTGTGTAQGNDSEPVARVPADPPLDCDDVRAASYHPYGLAAISNPIP
ncbi:hypothetical protein EDB84DRAFT_1615256 [Lactarius hengduanensis]|nr:hypothetical protein EDB84DRAFT_1615256 [Lactarius hengduanensis]